MNINPIYWLDRAADRAATYTLEREQLAVTEGIEGAQQLWKRLLVRLVVIFGAAFAYQWMPDPVQTVMLAIGGALLAMAGQSGFTRAQAYKRGWLAGRRRMATNLAAHTIDRAGGRQLVDASHWLDAEFNYDAVHVLGLPPTPPPS